MPRGARQFSTSGYMHLIIRGNGKQILFEDWEDHHFFLSILEKYCMETEVKILAYCLMDNHVHLLVHDQDNNSSRMMQKIGVSYSGYYNRKYEKTGHLFQDRFKSEAIEDEAYLLTVFRYILNNPKKAGICSAAAYEWNSFPLYDARDSFVDTSKLRELIGDRKSYLAFMDVEDEDEECMEYDRADHSDEWAKHIIQKYLNIESGTAIQEYNRNKRNAALKILREKGMSVRQIERFTGINRGIIQRI